MVFEQYPPTRPHKSHSFPWTLSVTATSRFATWTCQAWKNANVHLCIRSTCEISPLVTLVFLTAVVTYILSTQHDKEASFQQKRFRATSMHCSSPTKANRWRPKGKQESWLGKFRSFIHSGTMILLDHVIQLWKHQIMSNSICVEMPGHNGHIWPYTSIINLPMNSTNSLCSGPTSPLLGPLHHLSFHSHLSRSWDAELQQLALLPCGQPKRESPVRRETMADGCRGTWHNSIANIDLSTGWGLSPHTIANDSTGMPVNCRFAGLGICANTCIMRFMTRNTWGPVSA